MANKMKKDGAAADSVSNSTKTSNKEVVSSEILPEEMSENLDQKSGDVTEPVRCITLECFDPFAEKMVTETVDLNPNRMEFIKDFIADFVKEYQRYPKCPARVMLDCINDVFTDYRLSMIEQDMTDEQIYRDGHELFDCGMMLDKNYSKYHDEANKKIKETLRRHAPKILKEIENRKKIVDGEVK